MVNYGRMLSEEIKKMFPDNMVVEKKIGRNNGIELDGIAIRISDIMGIEVAVIYQRYEEALRKGADFNEILEEIKKEISEQKKEELFKLISFEYAREKLIIYVVNYEKNRKMLRDIPHRRVLDLAVTYRILITEDDTAEGTMLVNNSFVNSWNVKEDELFEIAMKNTFSLKTEVFWSVKDLLEKTLEQGKCISDLLKETKDDIPMIALTNTKGIFGANYILRRDEIRRISDELENDLYIFPSSVHELIMVPITQRIPVEWYMQLVKAVNVTCVPREDFLSNHVYKYLRDEDEIMDLCAEESD